MTPSAPDTPLRAALLKAARTLLERRGEDGVTIREVARRAGCALRSVYLHFPDRAALVRAVRAERLARLAGDLESVRFRRGDPRGRVRAALAVYASFHDREPDTFRALFDPAIVGNATAEETAAFGADLERVLAVFARGLVESAAASRRRASRVARAKPPAEPRARALALLSAAHGALAMKRCFGTDPERFFWSQIGSVVDWLSSSPSSVPDRSAT